MAFGFLDYNKAGKGVAKNGPEKKPFFQFWELFLRKFWKLFQLNILYVVFCIPIVTIGPATAAMTTILRKFCLEQPTFLISDFWDSFKKNFKQSFFIGLLDVVLAFLISYSIMFYNEALDIEASVSNMALFAVTLASTLMLLLMHFYIYLQIVALNLRISQIIKNAFLLAVVGIKRNFITAAVWIALGAAIVLTYPYSIFVMPFVPAAWMGFVSVFNSYPLIQKLIINPYYEAKGERNPELPELPEEGEALFEDFGGREAEIKSQPKTKGKLIR